MALTISIIGNLINLLLNYLLIYGKFGLPQMGYIGAAWASFYARVFMGVSFLFYIYYSSFTKEITKYLSVLNINWRDLKQLIRIGVNSAMQFIFEVAAFVIAGLMAGSFGKEQIDSHGIALSIAAFTYMFASGISSAATIRVGMYKAKENWKEIKTAAITSIKLALFIMGIFGLIFMVLHNYLPIAFSSEKQIVKLAADLLIIAALFQLFDGLQVTIIGVLRGLQDVKVPTVITLIGYWIIALPLAYFLAFNLKLETIGIWIGLLVSLVFVAGMLSWRLNWILNKNSTRNTHA